MIYRGTLIEDLEAGSVARMKTQSGEELVVYDFLLPPGQCLMRGTKVIADRDITPLYGEHHLFVIAHDYCPHAT